ncbi:uroporphyrinogen III synthase HEM4 [Sphingomonas sp. AP4-R1]|uniref:uroporphyrinogen-III synthase n=1 Tax=Sphingomonas sp. AP4-R1 TaxID=2735134 RepID=UPI001597A53D|nr:uroporphyrinogen III synthase HEM4 [Sphingomonas sp. AP4-R1]
MRLLVLRPEPGARATAQRIAALGHEAIVTPLFTVAPVAWQAPDPTDHDALILTSANAVRHAGPGLADLAGLPVYAVGAATATAAREAGLSVRAAGLSDGAALLAHAAADGVRTPLHLAGADHRAISQDGCELRRIIVYRADPVARLPDEARRALADGAIALLHSPRAAALFSGLVAEGEIPRGSIAIAAISAATARAAGEGWRSTSLAALPTDEALLAAALLLCQTEAGMQDRAGV